MTEWLQLDRLVADALRRAADRVVLLDDQESLTGSEVEARMRRVASWLRAQGVQSGDVVAACQANTTFAVVLFLATQRLGAVWAGVNPKLGPKERSRLINWLSPRVVVLDDPASFAPAPESRSMVLASADAAANAASFPTEATEPSPAQPRAPAAIAFTSGTTSAPKGVIHSGHNIALSALGVAAQKNRPRGPLGTCLSIMVFNIMILGPVTAILSQRRSVLVPSPSGPVLASAIQRHGIAEIGVPPTVVYDLLAACQHPADELRSLMWLESGGAACTPELADRYHAATGRRIARSYGLTEAPGTVAAPADVDRQSPRASGSPVPHVAIRIRGRDGELLPAGVLGEICIGPASDGPFAGMYRPIVGYYGDVADAPVRDGELRCGDMGYLLETGELVVVGRQSEMIIRGGTNISPLEVEAALVSHAAITNAVVFGVPDQRLGEVVAAAVEAVGDLDIDEIRRHVAEELSWSKAPSFVLAVDRLPRNPSGKFLKNEVRQVLLDSLAEERARSTDSRHAIIDHRTECVRGTVTK